MGHNAMAETNMYTEEAQRSKAWAHHNAQSEVGEDVPSNEAASGTARIPMSEPEATASYHAVYSNRSLQWLPAIVRLIWVGRSPWSKVVITQRPQGPGDAQAHLVPNGQRRRASARPLDRRVGR
jgi:hypothetical protein